MFSVTITSKRDGFGDELHRGVVDEHVVQLDVRVVPGDGGHDLPPEARGLEDVRLVDRGDPARARAAAASNATRAIRSISVAS